MSHKCLLEGKSSFSLRKIGIWMSARGEGGCGARRGEKRLRAWERIFSPFERVADSVKRREGEELGSRVPSPFFFFLVLKSWLQKECKEKRRNKEKEKIRYERLVKKGTGFPILLGCCKF